MTSWHAGTSHFGILSIWPSGIGDCDRNGNPSIYWRDCAWLTKWHIVTPNLLQSLVLIFMPWPLLLREGLHFPWRMLWYASGCLALLLATLLIEAANICRCSNGTASNASIEPHTLVTNANCTETILKNGKVGLESSWCLKNPLFPVHSTKAFRSKLLR